MRRRRRNGESGYILLLLILMTTMILIGMGIAAPRIAAMIRRDHEIEMIHRGEQYQRAIQRFYHKFGRYPTRIEELENTNNIRFLRRRYKDPMAKGTDPLSPGGNWRLLHVGDVKMGGFGFNNSQSLGSGFMSVSSLNGTSSSTDPLTGESSEGGVFKTTTTGSSANDVFGGGPIIGVASTVSHKGIHEFAGKSNYKEWYFVYDPTQDHGVQMHGPYNPHAFFGNFLTTPSGTSSFSTSSSSSSSGTGVSLPTIPGVTDSGGILGN